MPYKHTKTQFLGSVSSKNRNNGRQTNATDFFTFPAKMIGNCHFIAIVRVI